MDKGTTDTGKRNAGSKCSGWALAPFAVFATFYIGLSLAAGDFYKVPMTIAFILASFTAIAFGRKCSLAERIETYAKGMGEPNIMVMCLIFILAGAFAAISKGSGAVEAAVHIAETLVPPRLMVAGIFMVSAFISLAIGTSCGTIAAITPVAMAFSSELNLPPVALAGAVISGAMFGDNLSMISDTTIAATRTQGVPMRSKFLSNFAIAIPAAIVAFALYCASGASHVPPSPAPVTFTDMALVLPYILILVLALAGANVMTLIFAGTALATALGMAVGAFDLWGGNGPSRQGHDRNERNADCGNAGRWPFQDNPRKWRHCVAYRENIDIRERSKIVRSGDVCNDGGGKSLYGEQYRSDSYGWAYCAGMRVSFWRKSSPYGKRN